LYAVDTSGMPYWRSELTHESGNLPLSSPLGTTAPVWLDATSNDVALATGNAPELGFTVYLLDRDEEASSPWLRLASGEGWPAQLHVGDEAVYVDVMLDTEEGDPGAVVHELREIGFDGATRVLTTATGVVSFEVVGRQLFISLDASEAGALLRVVPLNDTSRTVDVHVASKLLSLTYSKSYFYFGTYGPDTLARLPNWLEQ
jgi:hypothetical protein